LSIDELGVDGDEDGRGEGWCTKERGEGDDGEGDGRFDRLERGSEVLPFLSSPHSLSQA
jgi:hypothetical protein